MHRRLRQIVFGVFFTVLGVLFVTAVSLRESEIFLRWTRNGEQFTCVNLSAYRSTFYIHFESRDILRVEPQPELLLIASFGETSDPVSYSMHKLKGEPLRVRFDIADYRPFQYGIEGPYNYGIAFWREAQWRARYSLKRFLGFGAFTLSSDVDAPRIPNKPKFGTLRTRHRLFSIPCWSFGIAAVSYFGFLGMRRLRKRIDPSRCRECGYDLRASPDRCPECGMTSRTVQRPV